MMARMIRKSISQVMTEVAIKVLRKFVEGFSGWENMRSDFVKSLDKTADDIGGRASK